MLLLPSPQLTSLNPHVQGQADPAAAGTHQKVPVAGPGATQVKQHMCCTRGTLQLHCQQLTPTFCLLHSWRLPAKGAVHHDYEDGACLDVQQLPCLSRRQASKD